MLAVKQSAGIYFLGLIVTKYTCRPRSHSECPMPWFNIKHDITLCKDLVQRVLIPGYNQTEFQAFSVCRNTAGHNPPKQIHTVVNSQLLFKQRTKNGGQCSLASRQLFFSRRQICATKHGIEGRGIYYQILLFTKLLLRTLANNSKLRTRWSAKDDVILGYFYLAPSWFRLGSPRFE
jgi:hypothetical protein